MGVPSRTSAPTPALDQTFDIQIILGKVRPFLRRLAEAHPQVLIIAPVTGRLVANCMFGFWANLLDQGGTTGLPAPRDQADYEVLWEQALRKAFKGGRAEAHSMGSGFERHWVHTQVKEVNDLRNRVAHHESLVNGYPLTGQGGVRRTAAEGYEACLRLARMIDRELAAWIVSSSKVVDLLRLQPTIDLPDPPAPCVTTDGA